MLPTGGYWVYSWALTHPNTATEVLEGVLKVINGHVLQTQVHGAGRWVQIDLLKGSDVIGYVNFSMQDRELLLLNIHNTSRIKGIGKALIDLLPEHETLTVWNVVEPNTLEAIQHGRFPSSKFYNMLKPSYKNITTYVQKGTRYIIADKK